MQIRGDLGSLHEDGGQMYGHGMASIALCEAYGMTHDKFLPCRRKPAINFIAEAQDPLGGGWRVLAAPARRHLGRRLATDGAARAGKWPTSACRSDTMRKAGYFLDHVQSDRGAVYGYQGPERGRPATTAIGLLCRMYLGWNQLANCLCSAASASSASWAPPPTRRRCANNMYYNYYATQVMHH